MRILHYSKSQLQTELLKIADCQIAQQVFRSKYNYRQGKIARSKTTHRLNYLLCKDLIKCGLLNMFSIHSRYYIKNTTLDQQLLEGETAIKELAKESDVHLLDLNALKLATQLMVNDFTVFRQIG